MNRLNRHLWQSQVSSEQLQKTPVLKVLERADDKRATI